MLNILFIHCFVFPTLLRSHKAKVLLCYKVASSAADVLLQELACKDQVRVAEVSRVRVELQEQIGHLDAERTAQVALKEKISALEREVKGQLFVPLISC